jgi:hypothetical protein
MKVLVFPGLFYLGEYLFSYTKNDLLTFKQLQTNGIGFRTKPWRKGFVISDVEGNCEMTATHSFFLLSPHG